mgnify:CR=1 FL=1
MTFKKLVQLISEIGKYEDCNKVENEIKKSFESGKITWKDHEMLWSILDTYYNIYQK